MKVTLIQATPNPIETIAQIASICYDSDPANPMGLVKHLYRNGHHSVFEHIYFTFKIEGISRACSHQLVRHRHCSFTQRSQRYCSEDGFGFVTPDTVDSGRFANDMEDIKDWYEEYQNNGVPNEDARYVLPNACSMLYGACCRIAKEMGYKLIITYILKSENGASLKASNFTCDGVAGGTHWTGKRNRGQEIPHEMKTRWHRHLC